MDIQADCFYKEDGTMKKKTDRAATYTGRTKSKYISAYLTEAEFLALQAMAVANETTINGMVRQLITTASIDNRAGVRQDLASAVV